MSIDEIVRKTRFYNTFRLKLMPNLSRIFNSKFCKDLEKTAYDYKN